MESFIHFLELSNVSHGYTLKKEMFLVVMELAQVYTSDLQYIWSFGAVMTGTWRMWNVVKGPRIVSNWTVTRDLQCHMLHLWSPFNI